MIWESGGPNPSPSYSQRMGLYNPGGGVPHARFGGTLSVVGGMGSGSMNYQPQYNQLIGNDSPLEMAVSMSISAQNELIVTTDVEVTGAITTPNNDVTFLVTLEADPDWFSVVVRHDHSTSFDLSNIGDTESYEYAFAMDPSWDITKLRGIALVQSYDSNYEILQAGSSMFTGLLPMFTTNITEGPAYLGVQFTSTSFPQTGIDMWEWDFDGDGTFDSTQENPYHLYTVPGIYDVTLRITVDGETEETTATELITVTDGSAISGDLSGIWVPDFSPYYVTDDTQISEVNELSIQPGVELIFSSGNLLTVYGSLVASADLATEDPIVFTSDTDWEGIRFNGSTQNNLIQGCDISKANVSAIRAENGTNLEIVSNRIHDNSSLSLGAAIEVIGCSDVLIANNIIANNTSSNAVGAIQCTDSPIAIDNNVIANNTGSYGAMILKTGSDATITNNTFANNESTGTNPNQFMIFNSVPMFTNSIFSFDGGLFWAAGAQDVSYSCVTGGYEGTGNIDEEPLFAIPSAGIGVGFDGLNADWRLQTTSLCIDAGNPDAMYNDPDGTRNDMGAYGGPEAAATPFTGIDNDPMIVLSSNKVSTFPNPFNPQTSIALSITEADKTLPVSVKIYNLKGQLVKTIVDNEVVTNTAFVWNGTDNNGNNTSTGMYFIKMDTASSSVSNKVLLLK
jgi:PKD repeat protein